MFSSARLREEVSIYVHTSQLDLVRVRWTADAKINELGMDYLRLREQGFRDDSKEIQAVRERQQQIQHEVGKHMVLSGYLHTLSRGDTLDVSDRKELLTHLQKDHRVTRAYRQELVQAVIELTYHLVNSEDDTDDKNQHPSLYDVTHTLLMYLQNDWTTLELCPQSTRMAQVIDSVNRVRMSQIQIGIYTIIQATARCNIELLTYMQKQHHWSQQFTEIYSNDMIMEHIGYIHEDRYTPDSAFLFGDGELRLERIATHRFVWHQLFTRGVARLEQHIRPYMEVAVPVLPAHLISDMIRCIYERVFTCRNPRQAQLGVGRDQCVRFLLRFEAVFHNAGYNVPNMIYESIPAGMNCDN